jgi:hypothetical protein
MLEKEIFKTSSKGKDSVHQGSEFYRTKMENRRELPSSNSIMRMMLNKHATSTVRSTTEEG